MINKINQWLNQAFISGDRFAEKTKQVRLLAIFIWTAWGVFLFVLFSTIQIDAGAALANHRLTQASVAAAPIKKTVMVMFPQQFDQPVNVIAAQAIHEEFGDATDLSLDVYFEYMDLNRFSDPAYPQKMFELYTAKYQSKPVDLVIVVSEVMLNLWLEHRAEIIPNAPIVFFDITTERLDTLKMPSDVTGVSGVEDQTKSVQWVLDKLPTVNEIVIVHGVGQADQEFIQPALTLQKKMKGQINFTDLSTLPLSEIKQRIAELPKTSIVLYNLMFEDVDGNRYRPIDVLRELTAVSAVPVIGGYDVFIGTGSIGGYMYSIDHQARDAAQIGLRILRGEAVGAISIVKDQSNRFIFDHLALQKFEIPLSALPPESSIKNRQYSFWELYRVQITLVSAIFVLLLALVSFLGVLTQRLNTARSDLSRINTNLESQVQERTVALSQTNHDLELEISERKHSEAALRESQELLAQFMQHSPIYTYIKAVSPTENRLLQASENMRELIGISSDQVMVGKTMAELFPPEFAEKISADDRAVVARGEVLKLDEDLNGRHYSTIKFPLIQAGKTLLAGYTIDITERKQAESALLEAQTLTNAIVESTSDLIWSVDPESFGLLTFNHGLNDNFFRGRGIQIQVGMRPEELFPPGDFVQKWREFYQRALAQGSYTIEYSSYSGTLTLQLTFNLLKRDGKVFGISVFGRDITERKLTEEVLRESELRFRAFVEQSPVSIGVFNLEGNGLYANRKFMEVLGLQSEKEMVGRPAYEFFTPQFREQSKERTQRRLQGLPVPAVYESTCLRSDGKEFPVSLAVAPIQLPNGTASIAFLTDITESKQAEETLHESEAKFRRLFETSMDFLYITSLDGRIIEVNVAAAKISGYSLDELKKMNMTELYYHPQERDRLVQKIVEQGFVENFEIKGKKKDGTIVDTLVTSTTIKDKDGNPTGFQGGLKDITERKRAEEDHIAREIAEQANRAKSEFLSRMSHELRTPLNAILGFSQLLKMDELKPNQTRGVEQIYKSGRHLLNLVNEVLNIARIESGKMHISPEPVRLADTLQEALELIRPLAETRGIFINLEPATPLDVVVQADPQSLRQVLLNLLSNAVKYNCEGGEIAITTSLTIDGHLRLQVRDTGEGIPPEKMNRLFTPFDRLDRDSSEQEGTGLGLALSKGLVEAMGGRIGASSKPGDGSIFWLELKLVAERLTAAILAEVTEHISEALRLRTRGGLVLYVEDNLDNFKLVEAIMERLPRVKLMTAMQGRLALELAQEHHPDLILLDLHLPDIHGTEVLRRLKAEPATQKTPVIILSADAMPKHIEGLLKGGAQAYLTKPIHIQEFLNVVAESLAEIPRFAGSPINLEEK